MRIYKLLESADVFVTNVRTRGLGHMGLDYETLKVKFPKLVMGQLGAYGTKGPDKDKPGYDNTAFWARSGFMYGQKVDREGEPQAIPVYQPMAVGDISCACALIQIYSTKKPRRRSWRLCWKNTSQLWRT
mgnify:CR=1 FL=1